MKATAPTNVRFHDAEARRERFLAAISQGASVSEACEAAGVSESSYWKWRERNHGFKKRVADARARRRKPDDSYDNSFESFRKHYLGFDTTWFQREAAWAIENAQLGDLTLILWPPGFGKTTLLEDWCTYKLANDPAFRITVCSANVDHPKKMLDRVKNRFDPEGSAPSLVRDFGPLKPESKDAKTWGAHQFRVAKARAIDERDYSMRAIGVNGNVQGTRADLMLIDDVQSLHNLELASKYFEIIRQDFLSRPNTKGRTVIIGTRVGEFDVYRMLIDSGLIRERNLITFPAYNVGESPVWPAPERMPKGPNDRKALPPEGVKFLWPEQYSPYDMARLRFTVGEQAWARNYMQRPEAASVMTFDDNTTKAMRDTTRSIKGDPRPIRGDEGGSRPVPVIIGVDPAIGGGNGVLAAAAYPDQLQALHCRLDYSLTKYSQIIELLEEECHRWTTNDSFVTTVVIEDKAFQKGLLQDDRLIEVQRRFGFRIVPNTTTHEKADASIGIPSMPMAMIRQEITIPWADPASEENMGLLLNQLHMWRPDARPTKLPQDLVMCLWFVFRQWRAVRHTAIHPTSNTTAWRSSPSPLRRRARPTSRRPHRRGVYR